MAGRVVVTGMGCISALGMSVSTTWNALANGDSGIAAIRGVDTSSVRFSLGAQIHEEIPDRYRSGRLDRTARLGLYAAEEAISQAGLLSPLGVRAAVILGTACPGQETLENANRQMYRDERRPHPMTIPASMVNACASAISTAFGVTGPVFAASSACASANHAIGIGLAMIRAGIVDVALAGGADAPFGWGFLRCWDSLRVVSSDTCRPFSRDRSGMILGEGAGVLVLEEEKHAINRGAPILAELVGCGMSADAADAVAPTVEGPATAIRAALDDAALASEEVGYVNAHGTGTVLNDITETKALRQVFGKAALQLPVSSSKGAFGHTLGAAGALEAIATVCALRASILPPTANFSGCDPDCELDCIPNKSRKGIVSAALSNAFAFGGLNCVLAFRRWEGR